MSHHLSVRYNVKVFQESEMGIKLKGYRGGEKAMGN